MTESEMWQAYTRLDPEAKAEQAGYKAWAYGGGSPEMSNALAQLTLSGQKTATASAYPCYFAEGESEPLPTVGEYNLILDTAEQAVCVTRTTRVSIVAFCEVTARHARLEGEGDGSLAYWRQCHAAIFSKELKEIGQEFTEDMPVVLEEFAVVYPVKELA